MLQGPCEIPVQLALTRTRPVLQAKHTKTANRKSGSGQVSKVGLRIDLLCHCSLAEHPFSHKDHMQEMSKASVADSDAGASTRGSKKTGVQKLPLGGASPQRQVLVSMCII